ncbi:hypothetical protein [Algoriphagus yeomjeoni]|uniref:Uncharacterized protein n=1 Tax=Algoriphagus yeomjeoni TaxID=291403 RepID=A0A327PHM8_9BACT|nr:hypothetical protein [Algoriphagus yeomjeoni]RAI91658.1 hypothetical protein LV83_01849 [Algoriphagus yeomjeoni]
MKQIELIINFLIGLFILGNLYYFSPLIGLSKDVVLVSLVLVTLLFSFSRFSSKIYNFLFFKLAISFIIMSLIFFFLTFLYSNYSPNFNNLIRVIWYTSFFVWTYGLYQHNIVLLFDSIIKWLVSILVVIIGISLFEYYNNNLFSQLIMNDSTENLTNVRFAGTYIDANSFAGALATYLFIYIRTSREKVFKWVYFLFTAYLINQSGSRMGLILLIIILVDLILDNFDFKSLLINKHLFTALFIVFFLMSAVLSNQIEFETNIQDNSETLFNRFFDDLGKTRAEASSNERMESLKSGLVAASGRNFIIPPGAIYFESKWKTDIKARHYPHNSIIFMFVEYGIYVIWPVYLLFVIWKRSKFLKIKVLFILLFFQLLLLPNAMYYSTFFLVVFYLDLCYENCRNTPVLKR